MFKTTAIKAEHWPMIMEIQQQAYSGELTESQVVLQAKWQLSPETCFAQWQHEQFIGYCLAHPWSINSVPKLHHRLQSIPISSALFIHDLALANDARGQGAAEILTKNVANFARKNHFKQLHLVAIKKSYGFWKKLGFNSGEINSISADYGFDALHLTMHL